MACEVAQVSHGRVRAVEQPQFHQFKRRDIRHQLRAGRIPARAGAGKAVFDHPLAEGFGGDRNRVREPQRSRRLAVGLGGRRHDAVHHGRRKGHVALDPPREVLIDPPGEFPHQGAHHHAVVRQVVAAHHGQRRAMAPARLQTAQQHAGRARRRIRMRKVVHDVRMGDIEPARCRIMAVTLFRHRERDHLRGACGDAVEDQGHLAIATQGLADRGDRLRPGSGGRALEHGIAHALRPKFGDHARTPETDAADSPARIRGQHRLGKHGLMGAMKVAQSQMDDADVPIHGCAAPTCRLRRPGRHPGFTSSGRAATARSREYR